MVDVADETAKFVEGSSLHQYVVLGEQKRGDLGQLADGRTVSVRNDGPQFIEGIVEVVHAAPLAGVDAETNL